MPSRAASTAARVAPVGLALALAPGLALAGCSLLPTSTRPQASSSSAHRAPPALPDGAKPLLAFDRAPRDHGPDGPPAVPSTRETELFPDGEGDVADDPAIWRNPRDPARSLIVGDDKSDHGGVAVYDLSGRLLNHEQTGKIGNIDIRPEFALGDHTVTLVAANDRDGDVLRFWSLDPAGTLTALDAARIHTVSPNYGFCLGRSNDGRHSFAMVTQEEGGILEQYELVVRRGRLDAHKVRTLDVGSQSEGCAVDDSTGALYVGEEDVGLWRYDLDPTTGSARTAVDTVGQGRLVADVEGVSTTRDGDGRGVLVVSSQGDSTFAVYDLDRSNVYLGSFRIRKGDGVDGVSETDGLAALAGDFGPNFPNGLLVTHDGENHDGDGESERVSDYKLTRLDRVLGLTPLN